MTKDDILRVFNNLQNSIGRGNAERGFHAEGDGLRANAALAHEYDTAMLRNYYMVKAGLIMSEGAEALEELRSGRPVDQNYYSIDGEQLTNQRHPRTAPEPNADGHYVSRSSDSVWSAAVYTPKPEGVPSEIADIVIRCFDFADEAGFSLIEAILEKLAYNDTRAHMHGRQV